MCYNCFCSIFYDFSSYWSVLITLDSSAYILQIDMELWMLILFFVVWFRCSYCLLFLKLTNLLGILLRPFLVLSVIRIRRSFYSNTSYFRKILKSFKVFYPILIWYTIKLKCGCAGSEFYVQTHITEPACLSWKVLVGSLIHFVWSMWYRFFSGSNCFLFFCGVSYL